MRCPSHSGRITPSDPRSISWCWNRVNCTVSRACGGGTTVAREKQKKETTRNVSEVGEENVSEV